MLALSLFLAVVAAPATCPERLMPVCEAVVAGRTLEAAKLAAPLARDPTMPAEDRRAAVAIAVNGWVQEGSPASRCAARMLLMEYLADPKLPRTASLERRQRELEEFDCDDDLVAVGGAPSNTSPASTPTSATPRGATPTPASAMSSSTSPASMPASATPPSSTTTPASAAPSNSTPTRPSSTTTPASAAPSATSAAARPRPATTSARRKLIAGQTLVGLGVGFAVGTVGAVAVLGHHLAYGRDLVDDAHADERELTSAELTAFDGSVASARAAQRVAIGLGVTSAVLFSAAIPLWISGRRSAVQVKPYADFTGGGLLLRGSF
ncbi:hypothetical protein [Nannocystis sp. SCPEA4]|uniref:hypothetical protein n=1 Tax=Nannocystis sp. SCPEA4 TaxID=2996787 RepID=UPI00226E338A|nr:hypothetical protein [Nannocystis sp. SCPEA4]MCY1062157.1 hypothetical protein [Nannocystis sp. SCPEA4]